MPVMEMCASIDNPINEREASMKRFTLSVLLCFLVLLGCLTAHLYTLNADQLPRYQFPTCSTCGVFKFKTSGVTYGTWAASYSSFSTSFGPLVSGSVNASMYVTYNATSTRPPAIFGGFF